MNFKGFFLKKEKIDKFGLIYGLTISFADFEAFFLKIPTVKVLPGSFPGNTLWGSTPRNSRYICIYIICIYVILFIYLYVYYLLYVICIYVISFACFIYTLFISRNYIKIFGEIRRNHVQKRKILT